MAARQRRPPPSIGKGAGTLAIAVLVLATGLTLFRAQAAPTSARAEDARPWDRLSGPLFQTFGQDQGLPPMTPTAIAQDGDGFVWIGTQGGLIRWDGYHFLTYSATPGGPNGLPGGWISALHTDPSGRLWIGTDQQGALSATADGLFVATPPGNALTAVCFAPRGGAIGGAVVVDGTVFTAIRHPGAEPGASFDRPGTPWPGTKPGQKPRTAVVSLTGNPS